jgi:chemotaxis signal transduction protein
VSGSLLFRCGERLLALPTASVDQVFRMVALAVHLPRSPRHTLGVVDCRGELVPLIDLGARLAICGRRKPIELVHAHVVVIRDRVGAIGFVVDEVRELLEVVPEPLSSGSDALGSLVCGTVRCSDGTLVPLIDPPMLLSTRLRHGLGLAIAELSRVEARS